MQMLKIKIFLLAAISLLSAYAISPNDVHESERYSSERNQLMDLHDGYFEINPQDFIGKYEDYLALFWDDVTIKLYYSNILERYGYVEESKNVLRKMEEELVSKSNEHYGTYRTVLGYQLYFARRLNDQKEFDRVNKKLSNLNNKSSGFLKEKYTWVKIDDILKTGRCPSKQEFSYLSGALKRDDAKIKIPMPTIVFIRLHFDLLIDENCIDQASLIYSKFEKLSLNSKGKEFYRVLFELLQSDIRLRENIDLGKSQAIDKIYNSIEKKVQTSIHAPWILDEISYRRKRITELENL
ncbi:hypothetical protein [Leptospira sp. GIMC2001]|uniref:hypothetical protein n=1 Tax=Leptospira sp. GIMC2001 TaxID=1513297 RepID=UPI00234A80AA|nr:hypothetical protein [Leptospira sp. GIMC2001]WCL50442.1 hypothetical protein O4O04_06375 [Leptospira sp. GIMC2001]